MKKLPRADHRKVIATAKRLAIRNATAETFWDGKPCKACLCQVVIAQTFIGNPLHGLAGTVRNAVKVVVGKETFYLDNPNGAAWLMLTEGGGNTKLPHRILPVREVLENAETIELKHGRSQPEDAEK